MLLIFVILDRRINTAVLMIVKYFMFNEGSIDLKLYASNSLRCMNDPQLQAIALV